MSVVVLNYHMWPSSLRVFVLSQLREYFRIYEKAFIWNCYYFVRAVDFTAYNLTFYVSFGIT